MYFTDIPDMVEKLSEVFSVTVHCLAAQDQQQYLQNGPGLL